MSKIFEYRNFRIIGVPGNYKLICNLSLQPGMCPKLTVARKFVSFDIEPGNINCIIIKCKGDSFNPQYQLKGKALHKFQTIYELVDALYESSKSTKQLQNLVAIPDSWINSNKQLPNLIRDRMTKLANRAISVEFTDPETDETMELPADAILKYNPNEKLANIKQDAEIRFYDMIQSESKQSYELNNESTIDESFNLLFANEKNYRLYRSINGHIGLLISTSTDITNFNLTTYGGNAKKLPGKCRPFTQSFADYNISELSIIYPGNHEVHKFYNFKKDDIILDYITDHYKFIRTKFAMAFEKASGTAKLEMPFINLVLPFITEKLGLTIYNGEQPRYAWSTVGDKIVLAKFNELQKTKFDSTVRVTSNFMMAQTLKYLGILNETQLNQVSVHIAGTLFEILVYMAERESKFEMRDWLLNTLFELSRKVTKNS